MRLNGYPYNDLVICKDSPDYLAEYNTFDYQTYNMHMTSENSVVTSNLYTKSSHFALF